MSTNDDTLSLRTKMAAMQPCSDPGPSDRVRVETKGFPLPSPSQVCKTSIKQGVVHDGIYCIASAIRRNDTVGFLELQEDNNIKVVALSEASEGQKVPSHPA